MQLFNTPPKAHVIRAFSTARLKALYQAAPARVGSFATVMALGLLAGCGGGSSTEPRVIYVAEEGKAINRDNAKELALEISAVLDQSADFRKLAATYNPIYYSSDQPPEFDGNTEPRITSCGTDANPEGSRTDTILSIYVKSAVFQDCVVVDADAADVDNRTTKTTRNGRLDSRWETISDGIFGAQLTSQFTNHNTRLTSTVDANVSNDQTLNGTLVTKFDPNGTFEEAISLNVVGRYLCGDVQRDYTLNYAMREAVIRTLDATETARVGALAIEGLTSAQGRFRVATEANIRRLYRDPNNPELGRNPESGRVLIVADDDSELFIEYKPTGIFMSYVGDLTWEQYNAEVRAYNARLGNCFTSTN